MWRSRRTRDDSQVTCIACGSSIARSDAREYDKHGDRWDRKDKEFEYLCKACHRNLCHQPRRGLESLLVESSAGECAQDAFLRRYHELVEEQRDSPPGS
ncbi:MAG: hypothetical protein ABEI77_02390 [Halorientalis sp.]